MRAFLEISNEWAIGAFAIAQEQAALSNSPVEADGSKIRLCAAACIASEGLRLRSATRRDDFIDRLKNGGGKHAVVDAFTQLGLGAEVCLETMRINDETSSGERIETFRKLLKI